MDCSPPGSSVHEIFQARILEWVAISFSRESSQPRDQSWVFCTAGRFFTYLSYKGSGLLWLPPGEFPNTRTEPRFPASQADSLLSKPPGKPKAGGGDGIPAELFQILKDDAVKVLHSICQPANLENSAVATGLEKVSFHSSSKEEHCQRMFKVLHSCTHLTH